MLIRRQLSQARPDARSPVQRAVIHYDHSLFGLRGACLGPATSKHLRHPDVQVAHVILPIGGPLWLGDWFGPHRLRASLLHLRGPRLLWLALSQRAPLCTRSWKRRIRKWQICNLQIYSSRRRQRRRRHRGRWRGISAQEGGAMQQQVWQVFQQAGSVPPVSLHGRMSLHGG